MIHADLFAEMKKNIHNGLLESYKLRTFNFFISLSWNMYAVHFQNAGKWIFC